MIRGILGIASPRIGSSAGFPLLLALVLPLVACSRSTGPERPDGGSLRLRFEPSQFVDDRTYSVGRVSLRAIDADDKDLAAQIFPVDRATGVIDVAFTIPAGSDLRVLVEPLGSGILPSGDRTESGVALQGVSAPFAMEAGGSAEVSVVLDPYIPDVLAVESTAGSPFLTWRAMPPAESHVVRVHERPTAGGEASIRDVAVPEGAQIRVSDLLAAGFTAFGFQVRSENRFSPGAFSDTLFVEGFPGGGGGGGGEGDAAEAMAVFGQTAYSSIFAWVQAEQLFAFAVTYAYLAGELSQSEGPVLTGTITTDGPGGFSYSPSPADRLVVDPGTGDAFTFTFRAFAAPDLSSASAFQEVHSDLDVTVQWTGLADARLRSTATVQIGGFDRRTHIMSVEGFLALLGPSLETGLTVRREETRMSAAEELETITTSGIVVAGDVPVTVTGTYAVDRDSSSDDLERYEWELSLSAVLGGRNYQLPDLLVRWQLRNGLVDSAQSWWAVEGTIREDGAAVGLARFSSAPQNGAETPPFLEFRLGTGETIQLPLFSL